MNLKNIISYIVLVTGAIFAFSSCNPKNATEQSGELTVIKFEEDSESFRPTDNFKNVSCIQLEMTEESVLGQIKKIIDVDGNLVILTKDNEVVVFNREDGKYIRHIGGAGEGPEEYIDAQDMFYNSRSGTIDVYDRMKPGIISYKISGEFAGKKPLPISLPYVECMEMSADGYLLISNQLAGGLAEDSDYAFTLISPDGQCEDSDPFAPVTVDGFSAVFALRPMSVCGNEMKYAGFLSDTISCVKEGRIEPLYKLELKNPIASKKLAAELGYEIEFMKHCISDGLLQGINKMFETDRYLILYPIMEGKYGFYWIDKETNSGYHISSDGIVDSEVRKVLRGETIIKLIGYSGNELISCFEDLEVYKRIFDEAISEIGDAVTLPQSVVSAIENLDPDGNPFLLIYSN